MGQQMYTLPIQPPIFASVGVLPVNAITGQEAIVLSSPPSIYIYNGTTWLLTANGSGGTITTVAGTSNQITSTGITSIALSFPAQMGLGNTNAVVSGSQITINAATTSAHGLNIQGVFNNITGNAQSGYVFSGTLQPTTGASDIVSGYASRPVFISPNGQIIAVATSFYANNTVSSNVGSILTLYGFFSDSGSSGAGIVSLSYGGYFKNPAAGLINCALHADSISLKTTASNSTSLTLGMNSYIYNLTSSSARAVTLPAVNTIPIDLIWVIKDGSGNALISPITITPTGCLIDGSATYVVNLNYGSVSIFNDGSNYWTF